MSKVPVMFLTAADEETDIIMGLDMGVMIILQSPLSWLYFYQELTHFFAGAKILIQLLQKSAPTASIFSF